MRREHIQALIKSHYNMISKLEDLLEEEPEREFLGNCSVDSIIESVNNAFNTNCQEQSRRQRVVFARHCAAYFLRKYTDLTLVEISNVFGNTDHTSAHHSIKTCKNLIETDEDYRRKVEKVKNSLQVNFD